MIDQIDIDTARAFFAHAIEGSEFVPDSAEIEIRAADPREQGAMLARFVRVFNGRLLDEQYSANDPPLRGRTFAPYYCLPPAVTILPDVCHDTPLR